MTGATFITSVGCLSFPVTVNRSGVLVSFPYDNATSKTNTCLVVKHTL